MIGVAIVIAAAAALVAYIELLNWTSKPRRPRPVPEGTLMLALAEANRRSALRLPGSTVTQVLRDWGLR